MKVRDLIQELEKYNPELDVAYELHSELCALEALDLEVEEHCVPRPDGWVQRYRSDIPCQNYLVFPGN